MEGLPPAVQQQIQQFQQMQQRYEMLVQQRQQLEVNTRENKRALEELEKAADDAAVYKHVGAILILSKKDTLISEIKDKLETFDMRLKTLERQETRVKGQLEEMQGKLQQTLQKQAGGPANFQPM